MPELALGNLPFSSDNPFDVIEQQIANEPPWPKWQPPELIRILSQCLAKDPEKRYPSFSAFQLEVKTLFTSDLTWAYAPNGPPDPPIFGPIQDILRDV